jgi:hypothetical protein
MPRDSHGPAGLRNLGPRSAAALAAAGIASLAELRRLGAVPAYLRVKRAEPKVSLNLLYALAGALQGCDWRAVQRTQKLELLLQLQAAEFAQPPRDELRALRNVGPAVRRDFELLGIRSVAQLARQNPDRLYARLQKLTGTRHDPCMWDTFAATIHQARSGEALPWWHFSAIRKARKKSKKRV